jgi:L-alanine-DL-glutamate epimerase-like enolase superfamily enzyme
LTDDFPWESTGDKITVKNRSMTAPNDHGIGVDIDPNYLAKAAGQIASLLLIGHS